jgi:RNase P subunit RPR2
MLFGSFDGRCFIDDVDVSTVFRTLCHKCLSKLYYRRDGGHARPGSEATALLACKYCGFVNRVQRITRFNVKENR